MIVGRESHTNPSLHSQLSDPLRLIMLMDPTTTTATVSAHNKLKKQHSLSSPGLMKDSEIITGMTIHDNNKLNHHRERPSMIAFDTHGSKRSLVSSSRSKTKRSQSKKTQHHNDQKHEQQRASRGGGGGVSRPDPPECTRAVRYLQKTALSSSRQQQSSKSLMQRHNADPTRKTLQGNHPMKIFKEHHESKKKLSPQAHERKHPRRRPTDPSDNAAVVQGKDGRKHEHKTCTDPHPKVVQQRRARRHNHRQERRLSESQSLTEPAKDNDDRPVDPTAKTWRSHEESPKQTALPPVEPSIKEWRKAAAVEELDEVSDMPATHRRKKKEARRQPKKSTSFQSDPLSLLQVYADLRKNRLRELKKSEGKSSGSDASVNSQATNKNVSSEAKADENECNDSSSLTVLQDDEESHVGYFEDYQDVTVPTSKVTEGKAAQSNKAMVFQPYPKKGSMEGMNTLATATSTIATNHSEDQSQGKDDSHSLTVTWHPQGITPKSANNRDGRRSRTNAAHKDPDLSSSLETNSSSYSSSSINHLLLQKQIKYLQNTPDEPPSNTNLSATVHGGEHLIVYPTLPQHEDQNDFLQQHFKMLRKRHEMVQYNRKKASSKADVMMMSMDNSGRRGCISRRARRYSFS